MRIAQLRDEWWDDVDDPEEMVNALRRCCPVPDLFTFWQRLPDITPKYSYYYELQALSALPLTDFDHWWHRQINSDMRKKAKRSERRGLEIKVVELDDSFVRGVMDVFNETPIRRGKPFWHYGKSFETLKDELSRELSTSKFIGAYDRGRLAGFVKLNFAEGRFVNPGLILSKLEYRKRYINNALMAKSVELACATGVPYLTYTVWRRGTQAEYLKRNGFKKISVPRYWVPLTSKGTLSLNIGVHRNVRSYIPDWLYVRLLEARAKLYERWYTSDNREDDETEVRGAAR